MNTEFWTQLPANPGARAKLHSLIPRTTKRKIKCGGKIDFRGIIYLEMTFIYSPSCH